MYIFWNHARVKYFYEKRRKKGRGEEGEGSSNINPELNYTAYFPDGYYTDIHTFLKINI